MPILEWLGWAKKPERASLEGRLQQLADTQARLRQSLDEIKGLVTTTTTDVFKNYEKIEYGGIHPRKGVEPC